LLNQALNLGIFLFQ